MSDFAEIYERIKMGTHRRTQVELACVLGIRQSSISDAKRRNSVPGDWFMKLFEKFGLSPDWLKYSVGPMYLRTEQGYMPADAPTSLAESTAYDGEDMTHGASTLSTMPSASTVMMPRALHWSWWEKYCCHIHSSTAACLFCVCAVSI